MIELINADKARKISLENGSESFKEKMHDIDFRIKTAAYRGERFIQFNLSNDCIELLRQEGYIIDEIYLDSFLTSHKISW